MKNGKKPNEQMTKKDNGLTATQEVLYQREFKRANNTTEKNHPNKK